MEVVKIPIGELTPDPQNAKDHPADQIEQIKASIKQFGNLDPIGVWGEENLIVEGHGRYEALKALGYEEAECIRLDALTEEERRAYALAHNQLTMNTGWIPEALDLNLDAIGSIDMSLFGFDVEAPAAPGEVVEDNYDPEPPEEPFTRRGDVWQMGGARLMCGDSAVLEDVQRLMGGEPADLVVTDPPYNIGYDGTGDHHAKNKKIKNDKMGAEEFSLFLHDVMTNYYVVMREGASIYVFYKELGNGIFLKTLGDCGITYRQVLVWVKNNLVLGGGTYQYMYEPCIFGHKGKKIGTWNGKRKKRSVIESVDLMTEDELRDTVKTLLNDETADVLREKKPQVADLHPTMKPVKLLARLIENSSKEGDLVLDLFGGSGSTLIACEQLGRRCYTMELDPRFCDVIINRWESFTGRKAVRLNG